MTRPHPLPCISMLGLLLVLGTGGAWAKEVPTPPAAHAAVMARAAEGWLALLTPAQRRRAVLRFDDPARRQWKATPGLRVGLAWGAQTAVQRNAAEALLRTGLSADGLRRFRGVVKLEGILRVQEAARVRFDRTWRDPGLYWIAVFGRPAARGTWSWRIEGHHYSRHFTCVDGRVSVTPAFQGANPAQVRSGPQRGLRVLADEEDAARRLLASFDAPRRARVVVATPPRDFVPYAPRDLSRLPRVGLRGASMTDAQRALLWSLLLTWGRALHTELMRGRFDAKQLAQVHFAWMGSAVRGQRHAYRIHGPDFVLEYWHGSNHIHSVWRDLQDDHGATDLARVKARAQPKARGG